MNDISRDGDDKAQIADQGESVQDQKNTATQQPASAADSAAMNGKTAESSMEAQLAEAQAKAAEYLDGWQRARADFVNYRKRSEHERAEAYNNATVDALSKILPVIDDFVRAIANVPAGDAYDDVNRECYIYSRKTTILIKCDRDTSITP